MASYCGGRWRSSSSVPNSWCPFRSRLQGVDFEQLFGNIKGSTEPASLVDLVGHLLPDIQQAQSAQYVKPNSSKLPAFVDYTIPRGGDALYRENLAAKLPSETTAMISDALNGAGRLHWIAVDVSLIVFVFYIIQQLSSNFDKYIRLLHKLVDPVKHLQNLYMQMLSHETEHLNEFIHAIVKEATTCCYYMSEQHGFGYKFACIDEANLQNFVAVINEVYRPLILMIAMDIQRKIARLYMYEPQALFGAVDIDEKIEEVMPCREKAQQKRSFYMASAVLVRRLQANVCCQNYI